MARIRRILVKNCCYHLMTRGNQKQSVFKHEDDYLIYLMLLKKFKRKYKFKIYAYCLMPNHIHLAAEPEDPANLPKLMLALNRTYTKYFNQKYEKVGHLWQGRYKSRIIAKDDYLFGCLSYIEANPVQPA